MGLGYARCEFDALDDVVERLEYLDGHPDYGLRPGYFHYGWYLKADEESKEAIKALVKAMYEAVTDDGKNALSVYLKLESNDQMSFESIVEDVLMMTWKNGLMMTWKNG